MLRDENDMFDNYFDLRYFFGAFFIGIFLVYVMTPTPEVILRYPTPQNAGKVVYQDSADMCYKYTSVEVPCSKDAVDTPIQQVKNKEKNEQDMWTRARARMG